MNRTKYFSNLLLFSLLGLALSGTVFAQEGIRTTIDMMQQGSIVQGYYDFDIADQTYIDGREANIWGWVPYNAYDELRIKRITDKSTTDPHIGIKAIPDNHSSSVRLATANYQMEYDAYGNIISSQSAAGGRVGYVFTVTEQNAIAILDYAVMLEYPASHNIVVDGNGWKYYQPWVQMFISVVDGNGNEYAQEPTRIVHAYAAPNGQSGWKQLTQADGWQQIDNVPLNDATTGSLVRYMYLLKKDWSSVGYDLRAAIGQTVVIWCEYYDCAISYKAGDESDPEICWDHHMARLYSSLNCTQPVLQKEEETCGPATVTYSAPEGFSYRWYTTSQPGRILSTDRTCTYEFTAVGEQTTLVCELQSPSSMSPTTLSVDIANRCELQVLEAGCTPQPYYTVSAPEGFNYSWHTSSNPNVIISTQQTCTYYMTCGEKTDLVCDLTTNLPSRNGGSLSLYIEDNCPIEGSFTFPTYVCADAATLDIPFEYTSGAPSSYDITFDANALANGFTNQTNQAIPTGATSISVPMPPSSGTQYSRPNYYSYTLRVHQCDNNDLVYSQAIEVRYPSWLIQQRWNDVLALYNQNYNGGYVFSNIEWYQDGAPAWSSAPYNTYIYQPGGLNPESEYWAVLTRTLDGLSFCTCPIRPVIQQEGAESSPERIQLTADQTDSRTVRVNTDLSGSYTLYSIDGKIIRQGYYGADYGSPAITLPAAGIYLIRFENSEQGIETIKWIAE